MKYLYLDAQDIGSMLVVLLNEISLAKDILLCIQHYLPHFFLVNTILQEDVKDWTVDVFTNALTRAEETAKRGSI